MAKYAKLEVTLIALLGALATALVAYLAPWWAALLPALLAAALLSFYRDPPRRVSVDPSALLSPADGRIMSIERDWRAAPADPPELRIVIFLSVFNVHVNRAPCAGRVEDIAYSRGAFLNALLPEATLRNENNLLTISPTAPIPGPVRVRQIAGLLAKRIVCALRVGDSVVAGERFGMIKLGSQTEIRVPEDARWQVAVRVGQHVCGGVTVLARV